MCVFHGKWLLSESSTAQERQNKAVVMSKKKNNRKKKKKPLIPSTFSLCLEISELLYFCTQRKSRE